MQRLIVRLGSEYNEAIHWLVYSEQENEIIASGCLQNAGELASLDERANSAEVIALVPTSSAYLTQVELPSKGAKKALSAIPFMVEEELAQNIEDLFFALGENKQDKQALAVVSRDLMVFWQQTLQEAGLFCPTLIPDVLCLPCHDDVISVLQLDQQLLVMFPDGQSIQGEVNWVYPLLQQSAQAKDLAVVAYSELSFELQDLELKFDFKRLPMQLLLEGAVSNSMNLFQNEFMAKRKSNPIWNKWKVAAVLGCIALTCNLAYTSIELASLKKQRAELAAETRQAVQQGFPSMRPYRNVRTAVQRHMAELEQGGGSASMISMIARLSPVFERSGVRPQTLRFDAKRAELRMQSVASSFDALEQFRREAESMGFEIQQGAINNRGDQVTGQIVVGG